MLRFAMEDISEGKMLMISDYYVSNEPGSPIKLFVGLPVRSTGRTAMGDEGIMGTSLVVKLIPGDVIQVFGEEFWERYKKLSTPLNLDHAITVPVPFANLSPATWETGSVEDV